MNREDKVRRVLPKLRKLKNTRNLAGLGGGAPTPSVLQPPSVLGQPPSGVRIPPSAL